MSIPTKAKEILDFIGSHEAPEGFDQYYGGIHEDDGPPRPLTKMTVWEVLNWQDSIDSKYPSEAAGRFQIMEDTLRGMVEGGQIDGDDLFNKNTQYDIGYQLLQRRGWNKFARGEITRIEFGNRLAKEWASLPVLSGPKRGMSYYAGDGLNSSYIKPEEVLNVLGASPFDSPIPVSKGRTNITQSTTIRAAGSQIVAGIGVAVTAIQSTEGIAQYMLIGGGFLVLFLGAWIMRERIKRWADGIR
jgi:muramidase (phage lysozyme)